MASVNKHQESISKQVFRVTQRALCLCNLTPLSNKAAKLKHGSSCRTRCSSAFKHETRCAPRVYIDGIMVLLSSSQRYRKLVRSGLCLFIPGGRQSGFLGSAKAVMSALRFW